jgi:hypothetical protein
MLFLFNVFVEIRIVVVAIRIIYSDLQRAAWGGCKLFIGQKITVRGFGSESR